MIQSLSKYPFGDWVFGILASLIAAVVFAAVVFLLSWLWRRVRSLSAENRRADETARIIRVFVHRRYLQRANVYSLSRGHFFVITRCIRAFIAGLAIIAMGYVVSQITGIQLAFTTFLGVGVLMFFEAVSWLDTRWSEKVLESVDANALADAAAILGETVDEVRSHVTEQSAS
ncbi:MAG: hypothetical protein ABJB97_10280 [Acidobacteriota bacterium]